MPEAGPAAAPVGPAGSDAGTGAAPATCLVVGAGLAGSAVAAQLARRGWQVTVLDGAPTPAAGASGVPVGIVAPHTSPDDALLSRLTRAGVAATLRECAALLPAGRDWAAHGVLQRHVRLPADWAMTPDAPSRPATAAECSAAGLPGQDGTVLHRHACWVRPAALVAAWLAQPGVRFQGGCSVAALVPAASATDGWHALDAHGALLASATRVVIAAGAGSASLAPGLPLQPLRGQLAWGAMADAAGPLPRLPVNGDGHLVAHVPGPEGAIWLTGATFERSADAALRPADTAANAERLARLHPAAAQALGGAFQQGRVHAWAALRCASADRRPLVGPVHGIAAPAGGQPPWICAALGSRGLTFAALAAQVLAARWHGEPAPLPQPLADALDTTRRGARPRPRGVPAP